MNQSDQFLGVMTIKELSKKIQVPTQTIRDWQTRLEDVLPIPRDGHNSRYYTEIEENTFRNIKKMRDNGLGFKVIREFLLQMNETVRQSAAASEEAQLIPFANNPHAILTQTQVAETMAAIADRMERIEQENRNLVQVIQIMVHRNEILESIVREVLFNQKLMNDGQIQEAERLATVLSESLTIQTEAMEKVKHEVSEQIGSLYGKMDTTQSLLEKTQAGVAEIITATRSERHPRKKLFSLFG